MGCFKSGCKGFIFLLNTLVLLAGLGLIGLSIYLIVEEFKYKAFNAIFQDYASYAIVFVPLAIGIIVSGMACCANSAVMKERRCLNVFFAVLQLVAGVVILCAGVALFFGDVSTETTAQTRTVQLTGAKGNYLARYVSDVQIGMYSKCCLDETSGASYFEHASQQSCDSTNADSNEPCFFSRDALIAGNNVDQDFCETITNPDNVPVYFCPKGQTLNTTLNAFQLRQYEYTTTYFYPSSIAFMVFGSLLFLAFFGSCYIACCARKHLVHEPQHEQEAGRVAGTGAPVSLV